MHCIWSAAYNTWYNILGATPGRNAASAVPSRWQSTCRIGSRRLSCGCGRDVALLQASAATCDSPEPPCHAAKCSGCGDRPADSPADRLADMAALTPTGFEEWDFRLELELAAAAAGVSVQLEDSVAITTCLLCDFEFCSGCGHNRKIGRISPRASLRT